MTAPRWSEMEGLVRVVALGVEGLHRLRPRMTLDAMTSALEGDGIGSIVTEQSIAPYKGKQRPAVDVVFYKWGKMLFRAQWIGDFDAWRISPHRAQDCTSPPMPTLVSTG